MVGLAPFVFIFSRITILFGSRPMFENNDVLYFVQFCSCLCSKGNSRLVCSIMAGSRSSWKVILITQLKCQLRDNILLLGHHPPGYCIHMLKQWLVYGAMSPVSSNTGPRNMRWKKINPPLPITLHDLNKILCFLTPQLDSVELIVLLSGRKIFPEGKWLGFH